MRKALLLSSLQILVTFFTVNAQVEKGRFIIAGSNRIHLSSGVEKNEADGQLVAGSQKSNFNFEFQPRAGYMVINNLAAGLFLNLDVYSSKYKDGSGYQTKGTTFITGPFARYYIPVSHKLVPFVEAQAGFGIENDKNNYNSGGEWDEENQDVFSYMVGAGATLFFNKIIGLDLIMGYNHESYRNDSDDINGSSDVIISNEFLMQLGIVVMLN